MPRTEDIPTVHGGPPLIVIAAMTPDRVIGRDDGLPWDLPEEYAHFLECIREGKQPQTDGYNGLRVVQIVEAAQRSLQNNGDSVRIPNGHVSESDLAASREMVTPQGAMNA